jgi:hypothetical protein
LVFHKFFCKDDSEEFINRTNELIDFLENSGFETELIMVRLIAALKHIIKQFKEYK